VNSRKDSLKCFQSIFYKKSFFKRCSLRDSIAKIWWATAFAPIAKVAGSFFEIAELSICHSKINDAYASVFELVNMFSGTSFFRETNKSDSFWKCWIATEAELYLAECIRTSYCALLRRTSNSSASLKRGSSCTVDQQSRRAEVISRREIFELSTLLRLSKMLFQFRFDSNQSNWSCCTLQHLLQQHVFSLDHRARKFEPAAKPKTSAGTSCDFVAIAGVFGPAAGYPIGCAASCGAGYIAGSEDGCSWM
jgi:hypothetical protein